MQDIAGKVALVTGGGSGMGRSMALACSDAGCKVVVADILEDRAITVAQEIGDTGGEAIGLHCDVSDKATILAMKAAAESRFGPVSLLLANAGATHCERLADMSDADVQWMLEVNLNGIFHCIRAFLPDMVARNEGHIVATSSAAAVIPTMLPYFVPYTAAKAGVIGLMMNLWAELQGCGVGCTVLCPSGVTTRMGEAPKYKPDRFGGPSDSMVRPITTGQPLPNFRRRDPAEVAQMVLAAVRENLPVVMTDGSMREMFMSGYVEPFLRAFDASDAFDHAQRVMPASASAARSSTE